MFSGAKPAQHVREGSNACRAGVGANGGHAGGSQTGGAGIAAAGKREDEPVATTAVTAGMKQLRKGQGKMSRRGEGPCGCLDFTGVGSFNFAGQPVVELRAQRGRRDREVARFVEQIAGPFHQCTIKKERAVRDAEARQKRFSGDRVFADRDPNLAEECHDGIHGGKYEVGSRKEEGFRRQTLKR